MFQGARALARALACASFLGPAAASLASDDVLASAFTAEPARLLEAARGDASDGTDATVLLDEIRLSFDDARRCRTSRRWVVSVRTAAGQEAWARIERGFAPWYESRPALRARVVTADGSVHVLDPKTVAEAPASESDPDLFTDRRLVHAPLPGVAPGSVIEEETVVEETAPLFAAGVVSTFGFGAGVPVLRTRMVVEYPGTLAVTAVLRGRIPITPTRHERDGRVTLVYETGRIEPDDSPYEAGVPSDQIDAPLLLVGTGSSWAGVADAYSKVVDAQIAGSTLDEIARTAAGGAHGAREIAERLLARVQADVRYTGVEFAEASIVPRGPSEVLKRKYGDCKDKAALLVAMLRAAGVPASVALVRTGPGRDVETSLPGLGGFNHVIVHVPGPPELWIDPTDDFARVGDLPWSDQGRLALVADAASRGLVTTPELPSEQNRTTETRVFTLPERGRAKVVEDTEWRGPAESAQRRYLSSTDRKALKEGIEEYTRSEYLAKGSTRFDTGSPADLSKPLVLHLEVDDAARGSADEKEAVVAILPSQITGRLPHVFTEERSDEEAPPASERAKRKNRTRTHDFVFSSPFVAEWRYRIVPPTGFAPAALPPSGETTLGTVRLSRRFEAADGGVVTAVLRLDSGKRRISPSEFEATRSAVMDLKKEPVTFVRFELVGATHLAAGRVREALLEFRRLDALHPAEALHKTQLANALLTAGLGDAARVAARSAVTAEPRSALAHRSLGWVLQHDRLGRRFRPGFDRAAAVASYRKAKELDPKDVITRADLAILLEHDAYGTRYSERADMSAAIAEYVALEKELKDTRFHRNLLIALANAGRFADLREAARGGAGVAAQDEFLVLAAAALDGAPAAIAEAGRLVADPPTRRQKLESVGRTLVTFRRYPEAAALLEAAATDAPDSAGIRSQVALLKKTRRYEEALPPQDDPRSALPRLIVLFSEPGEPDARALAAVFSKDALKDMNAHDEDFVRIVRALRSPIRATGLPRAVLLDVAISVMQLSVDGAPETGWRVRMRGAGDAATVTETYFVVREDGACRVVSAAKLPGQLGAEVLRRLARGDVEGARRWLDWARDEANTGAGDDPFSGAPFVRFWTKGRAETPERMRLAAAALAAEGAETAPKAIPILEEARRAASGAAASDLDAALAIAYERLNRDSDLLEAARRLLAAAPESRRAFVTTSLALTRLKRYDEAEKLADERLARIADDPTALRVLADFARDAGRFAKSRSAQERLVATGAAEAPDLNNMAWSALFDGTSLDEALTNAQRAVELTRKKSSAELNTLACLHAEAGHTLEARELALAAMDEGWRDEPEDADWYVLGRLAEQYGERDAALAAYRKVEKPRKSVGLASSPWTLAQRRLAAISGPS